MCYQKRVAYRPRVGKIIQFLSGHEIPREGVVEKLTLENGRRKITVDLEVAELFDEDQLVIGIDLFKQLGYELNGVPYMWPMKNTDLYGQEKIKSRAMKRMPSGVSLDGIAKEWEQVIADNQAIPKYSLCKLPDAVLHINTGDAKPVWRR